MPILWIRSAASEPEVPMPNFNEVLSGGVERADVAGVTAVLVDRDEVLWQGGAGVTALGGSAEMTPDTVGRIYSMTKPITVTAVMQCVERGLLDLDEPAGNTLGDLADPAVLSGFDEAGHPEVRPASTRVTLRHLLTHTSGYCYDVWNADLARWYEATGTPPGDSRQLATLRTPLMFEPGERWEYGIGIDWAGLMVEAATGQSLGNYLDENVLGPLGMTQTAFSPTAAMNERTAALHQRQSDGSLIKVDLPAQDAAPEFEEGGGGLFGTVVDYGRFMQMILNDGEVDGARILEPSTVATMCVNHIGDLRVSELVSLDQASSLDAELYPGEQKSWGLMSQIHEEPSGTGHPAGTLSWAGYANCYFWIDRSTGIAGAYMTQLFPFADSRALSLYYEFAREAYCAYLAK